MVDTDYVDITPSAISNEAAPHMAGRKGVVFQENEWALINNNPGRLTKEGVQKKVELWKLSANKHVRILYQTMLAQCKKLETSGKTKAGAVIYSRNKDGSARWVEEESNQIK